MTDPLTELERQLVQGVRRYAATTAPAPRRRRWRRAALLTFTVGVAGTGATVAAFGLGGDPVHTPQAGEALSVLRSAPPETVPKNNTLALMARPTAPGVRRASSSTPVVPDLSEARSVVVSGKRFWITTSVDAAQACIAADARDQQPSGATCAPLANLASGQPGIFETTRPDPTSDAPATIIGLVPDDTAGVRFHNADGTTSYHEATTNVVYAEVVALPDSIEAVRTDGTAGARLPIR